MRRLLTCLLGLALCSSLVLAQAVMTNATIIKMTKAGLTENVIISSIVPGTESDFMANGEKKAALAREFGISRETYTHTRRFALRNPDLANYGVIAAVVVALSAYSL
jgi:hypothetical protein